MDILTVVENIQRICKAKGTTPTAACKESGAGKDMVSNMKKKGTLPSIEKIRLLAEYLGVSTSDLLGETTQSEASSDHQSAEKLILVLQRLGVEIHELSDADICRIARLVRAILDES